VHLKASGEACLVDSLVFLQHFDTVAFPVWQEGHLTNIKSMVLVIPPPKVLWEIFWDPAEPAESEKKLQNKMYLKST